MNFRRHSISQPPLNFNVTSMVDVMMVLVVFLLGTWAANQIENDLNIRLPASKEQTPSARPAHPIVVNVRKGGELAVNQRPLDDAQFSKLLGELARLNPSQLVVVRADRDTPYDRILQVLDLCGKSGVSDIGFSSAIQPSP